MTAIHRVRGYLVAMAVTALCIGIAFLLPRVMPHASLSLVFVTGVLVVAANAGLGPSLLASVLGFLALNFFFTPPFHTLDVADDGDIATLLVFLVVATVTGNLAARMREEVDKRKLALEELEATRSSAETEQLRSALLSSVSHDLRTPLASIIGSTSSLLHYGDSFTEESRRDLLATILDESRRLDRHIQNLLDMTRLGQGKLSLARDWVDVSDIISSAVSRLGSVLEPVQVSINVPADAPLLYVHGVLIEQALVNLLDNAARFSPEGGLITVDVRPCQDSLEIRVCDQGPGIPAAEKEKIFDMFYTARQGDCGDLQGTGLGLAICRGMVAAHGGTVTAEDGSDGTGSCFRIRLPLTDPESREAT
tara:strand:+ start:12754 stop:13848 length:1095 start_codon:yes stop_codon:yes gene_type:complete